MLESKGYRCTVAHNGRTAQEHIKRTRPDLILSDMIMPEMDGIKLLEWVREFDRDIRVKLAHPFQKLDAVHLRHDHVAQDQVGPGALDVLLGSAAVVRYGATVALGFEHG